MHSIEYVVKGKMDFFIPTWLWMREGERKEGSEGGRERKNIFKIVQYGFYELDYENKAFE